MTGLQKLLAQAGLASRRAVEDWIRAGRITVGGRIARLGERASPGDDLRLDGRRFALGGASGAVELLLYYKRVGEVTTRRDAEHPPTGSNHCPRRSGRWIAVGRLDVNTSGLLLLTTDGELAHRLMRPSGEVEREYLVRLRGRPGPGVIERLLRGIALEDGRARFGLIPASLARTAPEATVRSAWRCTRVATARCGVSGRRPASRRAACGAPLRAGRITPRPATRDSAQGRAAVLERLRQAASGGGSATAPAVRPRGHPRGGLSPSAGGPSA